jgi:cation:H+ antiporter
MQFLIPVGLLILGGALLYFGAEWLVKGAAGLATALGVSSLVVGLTVVSYGTSAPELAVSVLASLEGSSDIALGNVIGSNIANIGLILGTTAVISPPLADASLVRRELPVMLLATLALPAVLWDGALGRADAAIFIVGSVLFTYGAFRWSTREPPRDFEDASGQEKPIGNHWVLIGLVVLGLVVLFVGGKVFVSGAVQLALQVGMSERTVGLTVVAIGTSLPELAASLVAALRGHSAIAIGNVVGSNIFNLLLVLGAAGLVLPIQASVRMIWFDLAFVGGLTLACTLSLRRARKVGRTEGVLYLLAYVSFLAILAGT